MRPEQRMRTRRSIPGCAHPAGSAARASRKSESKAASGERFSWPCEGEAANKPAAIARPQARVRVNAAAERHQAGNSTENLGTTDLNNVHFAERIRPIAIYRPPLFGAKNIPRHRGELLAGNVDQDRAGDPQRQTALLDDPSRQFEIDKPVMGNDGAAAGCKMHRAAAEERIEQHPPVGASGTPARQTAADLFGLPRKMREVCGDQAESAPGDGLPHVAAVKFEIAAVPEFAKEQRTREGRFILDVDAAQRGSPHAPSAASTTPLPLPI